MTSLNTSLIGIDTLRQKSSEYLVEKVVFDFLEIWAFIHENAKNYDLADALTFSRSIFESHIRPFFKTHKKEGYLILNEAWFKSTASIAIDYEKRGYIFFPLNLITYEICYHQKNLLDYWVNRILTKEVQATKENLFEFLFPILTNFPVPLRDLDIQILKTFQIIAKKTSPLNDFNITQSNYAENFDVSLRTVQRRLNVIRLMQIVQSRIEIDMSRLGYETTLFIHQNPFPEELKQYLLLSSEMSVGTFSLVQIPYNKTNTILSLQDEMVDAISQPMSVRTYSWNLSNISSGEELWKTYPPFFYGNPNLRIIAPNPDFEFSLEPTFEPFRSLTAADIKILDYLALQGSFHSVKDLSKSINVSFHQVSRRLKEYETNNLLLKAYQFFNIALDLSVFFFISSETKEIPWIQHFLSFPKVDVYSQEQESPYYYYGHFKIPNKWIKPFARKIDRIRKDFDVKCYYKIFTPIDHARYSISLKETYE